MLAASCTLNDAHIADAPVSLATASTNSFSLAISASPALMSSERRWVGPMAAQAGNALEAASTAATASSTVAAGAVVATFPSSGLQRSKVAPLLAAFFWPFISREIEDIIFSRAKWVVWNRPLMFHRHRYRAARSLRSHVREGSAGEDVGLASGNNSQSIPQVRGISAS